MLKVDIENTDIVCEERSCSNAMNMRNNRSWVLEIDISRYPQKESYYCCSRECCEKLKEFFTRTRDGHYIAATFKIIEGLRKKNYGE